MLARAGAQREQALLGLFQQTRIAILVGGEARQQRFRLGERGFRLIQRVERLSVGRRGVQSALAGESVLIEVADRVRPGDAVYKVRAA